MADKEFGRYPSPLRENTDNLFFMKLETFSFPKHTDKQMKWEARDWEKIPVYDAQHTKDIPGYAKSIKTQQ